MKENRKTRKRQMKAARLRNGRASKRTEKKDRQGCSERSAGEEVRWPKDIVTVEGEGLPGWPFHAPLGRINHLYRLPPTRSLASSTSILTPSYTWASLWPGRFCALSSKSFPLPLALADHGRQAMKAIHGGWPLLRRCRNAPGRIWRPQQYDAPSANTLQCREDNMHERFRWSGPKSKDSRAMELRMAATVRGIG